MTPQEEISELRRIVTSLVDVLLTEHCGTPGNWGYPLTSVALQNIKSNLMTLADRSTAALREGESK
jgi:hypothetical protein